MLPQCIVVCVVAVVVITRFVIVVVFAGVMYTSVFVVYDVCNDGVVGYVVVGCVVVEYAGAVVVAVRVISLEYDVVGVCVTRNRGVDVAAVRVYIIFTCAAFWWC